MGRIPDEIIQLVRDRVDIVDLVGRHVNLRQAGRTHKGLCPFHGEKTPSFVVTRDRGTFKCFGCGEGGNVFTFLMKLENLSFPEALRMLAAEHGIEIPETGGGAAGESAQIFEANALAQEFFRASLKGSPAERYLEGRGLAPAEIERFGIGFAPDRWDGLVEALRKRGIPAAVGEKAGLLKPGRTGRPFDHLRGRVTFAIRDVRGRVLGFGGRALSADQEPKYLNTPESPVFHKRRAFFGFPDALEPIRREERAVVCEGYFDRLALHRAGIESAVATCGTALSQEHARELRRRTRNVVLLFDGDEAGQKAMERSLELLLPEELRVFAAVLPAGEDPDSFLLREGAEALRQLVDQAPAALEIAIRRAVARGCATPAQKADAVAAVSPLLAKLQSPVERGAFEDRLALLVGVDVAAVRAAVHAERRGEDPREAVPIPARRTEAPPEARKLERLARNLIEHPHLAGRLDRERLADLSDHPVVELIRRLVDLAGREGKADLEVVSEGLSPEARSLLYAFAADDAEPPAEADAAQAVDDTQQWLLARAARAEQAELTRSLAGLDMDAQLEILRAKQARPAPERRTVRPSPPGGTH